MSKARAQFKVSLRYCRKHEENLRADSYAQAVANNDYKKFWNNISNTNNAKAGKYANVIDGCIGDKAIVERWRLYYNNLYNSISCDSDRKLFFDRLNRYDNTSSNVVLCVNRVVDICSNQKIGKSPGPDGISGEALKWACKSLFVHLSFLFNLFLKFDYLPTEFMQSVIIPLVKNKTGDLSDLNNYRAIAISSVLSKVFESLLADYVHSCSIYDDFQFGFKSGHSTSLCTNVLKSTIDYYRSYGSHVFTCFVDFSKAFDNVNYYKLFMKLLDDDINHKIVKILAYFYSNQTCFVRWRNAVSTAFNVGNGTRQGSVLSPYLFARYIRDLIGTVADSGVGCTINNQTVNILAYADDIVLISPSWRAMQQLISILHMNSEKINLSCNTAKTVAMVFQPKEKRLSLGTIFPPFMLGDVDIKFVNKFKYLGHILTDCMRDDEDIKRELRNTFIRVNTLVKKFKYCSLPVKTLLFKSYCLCFYDLALWSCFYAYNLAKFRSCYNRCAKKFFGYKRQDSLSEMHIICNIPSFDTVIHNANLIFKRCCLESCNSLVKLFI